MKKELEKLKKEAGDTNNAYPERKKFIQVINCNTANACAIK